MKKTLNIIFTIDSSYIQHFTSALVSVCDNNKNLNLRIFVIHDIQNLELLNEIIKFFNEKYSLNIKLLSLERSLFENYKIALHFSKAVYFRLMIADIMPNDINRAVFLDSDIIVTGSLEKLVELDFKDNFIFADSDLNTDGLNLLNQIGLPAKKYFNAGIMLLNLDAWRKNKISEKLISTAEQYMDKLTWWDQDVLNICFFNKWAQLPPGYNERNIRKKLKEIPTIIHFSGSSKPWQYLNSHPYKSLYWKYLKLSPFKNSGYTDFSIKNLIKRIIYFNRSF